MIIAVDSIIALPRLQTGEIKQGIAPWTCSYVQIESVQPFKSQRPGYFGIRLNFYNRDADASKIEVITFECKEQVEHDADGEEVKGNESAVVSKVSLSRQDLATQFINSQMNSKDGMKPMEFSVLYLIQR